MADLPPGIHCLQLPTPFPVGPVNLYLFEGDPLTLVDTGPLYDPAQQALWAELERLGYNPSQIGRIIVTHSHSDHCGLAAQLVKISGAELLTHPANFGSLADHPGERGRITAFYATLLMEAGVPMEVMQQIGQMRQGYSRFSQPVDPDGPLEEGMSVRLGEDEWQVLHTPGHTGGLICLYQAGLRLLVSSDHLLRDVSSNPIVEPPSEEGAERPRPLIDYVSQLQRVSELPIDLALPGHGPPITDVPGLISSRLAFHDQRAREVLEVLEEGESTVYEISVALFPSLYPINRFLAISEVIGHLDLLEHQGKAVPDLRTGVTIWKPT